MKKSIISTIFAISSVGVIAASALFLPSYIATKQYNLYLFDYQSSIQNDNFKLNDSSLNSYNIDINEAINGTSKINNGNYIIYIGSEGIDSNLSFLYNQKNVSNFENNYNRSLMNSDFGDGMLYMNSLEFQKGFQTIYGENAQIPQVLTYIDRLDTSDFKAKKEFNELVNRYKKLPTSPDSEEIKNLNLSKEEEEKLIKENQEKKTWASKNEIFSFEPGKTYQTWDGHTRYYRQTYQSGLQFDSLRTYVTDRFNGALQNDGMIFLSKITKDGSIKCEVITQVSSRQQNSSNRFLSKYIPNSTFANKITSFYLK